MHESIERRIIFTLLQLVTCFFKLISSDLIAWIILPFMNGAIEALTLFGSAAAFETYPWRNGENTEDEPTQRSHDWVLVVEEGCCLRGVRRRGLTCPRTLGWAETGTIATLQNAPTSSFPLIKLATCALMIQLSDFSVMLRYHHRNVFFSPRHVLRHHVEGGVSKAWQHTSSTCCEERAHRPPWETCRTFGWCTNRKHSFLSVSEVSSVCLHTVCWNIGTFSLCVCSLEALLCAADFLLTEMEASDWAKRSFLQAFGVKSTIRPLISKVKTV